MATAQSRPYIGDLRNMGNRHIETLRCLESKNNKSLQSNVNEMFIAPSNFNKLPCKYPDGWYSFLRYLYTSISKLSCDSLREHGKGREAGKNVDRSQARSASLGRSSWPLEPLGARIGRSSLLGLAGSLQSLIPLGVAEPINLAGLKSCAKKRVANIVHGSRLALNTWLSASVLRAMPWNCSAPR